MPKLDNHRHEAFARELAKGTPVGKAYMNAGYKDSPAAATRTSKNSKIVARVAELQEKAADKVVLSSADLIQMLLEDRQGARQEGQYSAAVSAVDKVAKIAGAYAPEKREHTGKDGGPIETSDGSLLAAAISQLTDAERAAILPLLEKL